MHQSINRFHHLWSATTPNRLLFLCLALLLLIYSVGEATANVKSGTEDAAKVQIQETYGKLPLYFIQNDGQVDEKVKFYEKGNGHSTFFTKDGVYISLLNHKEVVGSSDQVTGDKGSDVVAQFIGPSEKAGRDRPSDLSTSPIIASKAKQSPPQIPSPLTGEGQGGGARET